ncbi:hypothetical protein ACFL6E_04450 [Candidatus Neomarinimicrobiota bacterium]
MNDYLSKYSGIVLGGLFLLTSSLMGQGFQGMEPGDMLADGGQPPYMQQPDMPGHGMPGRGMQGRGGQGAMFKLWKLTEYLDLTEEQGAKFFPRFNEHKDRVEELREEQEKLSVEFMEQVNTGKVGKKDTEAYLDQMSKLQKAHLDERYKHIRSSSDLLSDEQYARYAAFDDHFRQQIKERMGDRRMRDRMQGQPGGKRNKFKKDKN